MEVAAPSGRGAGSLNGSSVIRLTSPKAFGAPNPPRRTAPVTEVMH
jgi:hypothetical protein